MKKLLKILLPENESDVVDKIKNYFESELKEDLTLLSENANEISFVPTKNEISKKHKYLNDRELEILELMTKGFDNKKIAKKLFMGEQTIKNHITSIFKKLAVKNRTNAVIYALKNPSIFDK